MIAPSKFNRCWQWAPRILGGVALGTAAWAADREPPQTTFAPTPEFSIPGGIYRSHLTLHLTAAAPSAAIRYTLDRSAPTETSPLYSEALALTNSAVVRARAFSPGLRPSAVGSQGYTLADDELWPFHSTLPLVIINTFGQEIVHESKLRAEVRFIDTLGGSSSVTGRTHFAGQALINIRGRASLRYPKHSYTVKTVDDADDPVKASILGLPADSDWVLYAPYPDKTLMRDVLAYELSNQIGRYAPRTRFVEAFVHEAGTRLNQRDYVGVYVLEERIKRGQDRVNIHKLGPEDHTGLAISGGYVFKKDHSGSGDMGNVNMGGFPAFQGGSSTRVGFPTGPGGFPADPKGFQPALKGSRPGRDEVSSRSRSSGRSGAITNRIGVPLRREKPANDRDEEGSYDEETPTLGEGFRTVQTNHFYYVDPEPDEITGVQKAWLKDYLNRLETALYGPRFTDPREGYPAFIDVDSFIDYHLLVEITKNVDGFRFSTFYHKDRGEKVRMGPLWDWNLSFGNANGKQGWIPEYWLWPQLDDQQHSWFRRLFEDPDFSQRYVDRWGELRARLGATSNLLARVDQVANLLHEAQARNFERWPILGRSVHPNYFVGNSYEEEVTWMKNWLATRLAWMDQQFVPAPSLKPDHPPAPSLNPVSLAAPVGRIYYTLDGTDPRAPGGGLSPKAQPYTAPVRLGTAGKLFARTQLESRWSNPRILDLKGLPKNSP